MRRLARSPLPSHLFIPIASRTPTGSVCAFCQHRNSSLRHRSGPQSFIATSNPYHFRRSCVLLENNNTRIRPRGNLSSDVKIAEFNKPFRKPTRKRQEESDAVVVEGQKAAGEVGKYAVQDATLYEKQRRRDEQKAFQEAVEEAPEHEDYIPADTWDGLEIVGGETDWDTGRVFQGFKPAQKLEEPEEIRVAIHRAVVEVFAAFASSRPLSDVSELEVGQLVNSTRHVRLAPTPDGQGVILSFPNKQTQQTILFPNAHASRASVVGIEGLDHLEVTALGPGDSSRAEMQELVSEEHGSDEFSDTVAELIEETAFSEKYTLASLRQDIRSWGRGWHSISLADPQIKFAILKRILQLSGATIPDPLLPRTISVGFLISELTKSKPPISLFETLVTDIGLVGFGDANRRMSLEEMRQLAVSGLAKQLVGLPNVRVMGRRETPVDRERVVGRWKVIEEELKRRDLPVLGRGW